mgnify:CR=1 FL=1
MKQFFGALLMGCGILVAGVSGLCTLLMVGGSLLDTSTQDAREFATMIPAVLLVGGIPLVLGLAMFLGGRHAVRSAEDDTKRENEGSGADVFK